MRRPEADAAARESADWLARIGTGPVAAEDREQLARWRAQSVDNDEAWQDAKALGAVLREVGREIVAERSAPEPNVVAFSRPAISRRLVMTGSIAASLAGVAILARTPDVFGPAADFETSTGEARSIALAPGITVRLDAETRIAVDRTGRQVGVELLAGRAGVVARVAQSAPVVLVAGGGRTVASNAKFDIRLDGDRACISCLAGNVAVEHGAARVMLAGRQQLLYDDAGLGALQSADAAAVTAWEQGQLVFHQTPLSQVVREVNRYRDGEIIILNDAVGRRPVNGIFHVGEIDAAVAQMQQITGARVTRLPGGVVVLT